MSKCFNKPIVLNAYTSDINAYQCATLKSALEYTPTWIKELPGLIPSGKDLFAPRTIKGCYGMLEYIKKGVILPSWSDIKIKVYSHDALRNGANMECEWFFAYEEARATHHDRSQYAGYLNNNEYQHVKLIAPWRITCEEDIQFVWVQPEWRIVEFTDIHVITGVVDYKHQNSAHVNMFLRRWDQEDKVYTIPFGMPLAHIIPLSDRRVEVKHHLIDHREYTEILQKQNAALSWVKSKMSILKKSSPSKCPMSSLLHPIKSKGA